jgi:hypothetical protein
MADNPGMHLLIPLTSALSADCAAQWPGLSLPRLDALLRRLTLDGTDVGDSQSLTPPHERALAAAHGLSQPQTAPDGLVPWGAWHAAQAGHTVAPDEAWAVITPCHWAVQTNHITMVHPRALNLAAEESRALLAAMQPYFAGSGITLVYDTPMRWLARGPVFAGLATASPYRVVGGRVDDWIPKGPAARELRRLQQEMQMLLYTHPLTDARSARGALAVNSFWVSGTGAWAVRPGEAGQPRRQEIVVPHGLRDAAIRDDWSAWAQAWQAIDADECQALLDSMARGEPARLTLCGERSAWTWTSGQPGLRQRLQGLLPRFFGRKPFTELLKQL